MRSEAEVEQAIERYADLIRRLCLCHVKNRADTEDVFQNVFLKYLLYEGSFADSEHEKAWFIRVTVNACRDTVRQLLRKRESPLEVLAEESAPLDEESREVLAAVLSLPRKYRDAVYLHYYEGYSAGEIAEMLRTKENTVYSLLSRGRTMLREQLGGDGIGT